MIEGKVLVNLDVRFELCDGPGNMGDPRGFDWTCRGAEMVGGTFGGRSMKNVLAAALVFSTTSISLCFLQFLLHLALFQCLSVKFVIPTAPKLL